jgi:hypothetical protein
MNHASIPVALLGACLAFLHGCANPINAHTAQRYYENGVQAERGGDLALARMNYSRAHGNAQLGNLGPAAEASYLYEYARATGYLGEYADSEKAFLEVLTLLDKAAGSGDRLRPPALTEYARLLHDTAQHQKAVSIFERAITELEKVGIESSDPLGYAAVLDDYAESLKLAGFPDRAAAVTTRSGALKAKYKNATPQFQARRYRA